MVRYTPLVSTDRYTEEFQIFSKKEQESLRTGGKILHACLEHVAALVAPGISTAALDQAAERFILDHHALPAFKGYRGFPGTLCTSVNDEVVHGIPSKKILKEGDIVSLDCGVLFDDLYTDACVTVGVGEIAKDTEKFLRIVSDTLEEVLLQVVRAGAHVGDVSSFIEKHLKKAGYSPVPSLTGHGLGVDLHQFPDVPNVGKASKGPVLPAGTMIAIEPIAAMGSGEVFTESDQWTIRTKDQSLACHFEHSVLITEQGCEVLA